MGQCAACRGPEQRAAPGCSVSDFPCDRTLRFRGIGSSVNPPTGASRALALAPSVCAWCMWASCGGVVSLQVHIAKFPATSTEPLARDLRPFLRMNSFSLEPLKHQNLSVLISALLPPEFILLISALLPRSQPPDCQPQTIRPRYPGLSCLHSVLSGQEGKAPCNSLNLFPPALQYSLSGPPP